MCFKRTVAVIILVLLFLELTFRAVGMIGLSVREYRNRKKMRGQDTYRILCLGDSLTQDQYPRFLEERLNERIPGARFSVMDKGMAGMNTLVLSNSVESLIDEYRPDMICAMIGLLDREKLNMIHMTYKEDLFSRARDFFISCRVCRLMRLLWLHVMAAQAEFVSSLRQWCMRPEERRAAHITQAHAHRFCGRFDEAEADFRKAMASGWAVEEGMMAIGDMYVEKRSLREAEILYTKALESSPNNPHVHRRFGRLYHERGDLQKAEEWYLRCLSIDPDNIEAYKGLGLMYYDNGRFSEAEESYRKAVLINPADQAVYIYLSRVYGRQDLHEKEESMLLRAMEINPQNDTAYIEFGQLLMRQGRYDEAEQYLLRAVKNIQDAFARERIYVEVSFLYKRIGRAQEAREWYNKAIALRVSGYNFFTHENYRKIKDILDRKGVQLVCVQYPLRSLEPLKRIFEGKQGVVFVDNERLFKEAVSREGYQEYFWDRYGGDFGHCTEKGNRLIADNIADTIVREVFHQ